MPEMTTSPLELREYRRSEAVRLTPEQLRRLRATLPGLVVEPAATATGAFDLTPGATVGVVALGDLHVEVRPKLAIDRVLFLLSWALGAGRVEPDFTSYRRCDSLLDALVLLYTSAVEQATRRGLLRRYREEENSEVAVRGRIRFEAQVRRRFGVFPPAELRFEEFTEDIEANRILKAALVRLARLRLRMPSARARLHRLLPRFGGVPLKAYTRSTIPVVPFDRLSAHYQPSVALARFILAGSGPELGGGNVTAQGLLINMNQLFEDFCVAVLRHHLGLGEHDFPQGGGHRRIVLDRARRVSLKPDISWWRGQHCVFVGDIKYKRTSNGAVPNADLYQVLAYATALGLPSGLLLYAAGEAEPVRHVVRHGDTALTVAAVDLSGSPESILDELATVAGQIRQMVRQCQHVALA